MADKEQTGEELEKERDEAERLLSELRARRERETGTDPRPGSGGSALRPPRPRRKSKSRGRQSNELAAESKVQPNPSGGPAEGGSNDPSNGSRSFDKAAVIRRWNHSLTLLPSSRSSFAFNPASLASEL